ncbi:MAG: phosphate regulon sensor histidine kinase PhoR [Thiohalomonadaceae bacterium]
MPNPWLRELRRVLIWLALAGLIAWPLGYPLTAMLLVLGGYFIWHLRNMYRLYHWLRGHRFHPPEASGIWGEILDMIYRLQVRHRQRKRRLSGLIKRFQAATEAMPDATVILDDYGAIEWFNAAAEQQLALQPGRDQGQRIINLIRYPQFKHYLEEDSPTLPLRMAAPGDPGLMLSVRVVPYGSRQRLLIARDITQQLKLENMRRDFVANVSHELRTPLTVVNGFLETLNDDDTAQYPPHLARSLELMAQQTSRMQHLVEDLLLLSRLETDRNAPPHEPVRVAAMLAMIREAVEPLIEQKDQQLHIQADQALFIYGAEKELYSAFSNLITNAVRYTQDGGEISVHWYQDGKGTHFEVRDNGQGIAPQHIPRLTERFYRADTGRSREVGGTGLGLAIVKHVLNRHQAALRISSTQGKGSTFSCDFPENLLVEAAR